MSDETPPVGFAAAAAARASASGMQGASASVMARTPTPDWETQLLEADFPLSELDLDFFGLGSFAEPEGFPLSSGVLAAAALGEDGEAYDGDASSLSLGDSDADSETTAKKKLAKRNKRERERAVVSRKRKRAQMEALLKTNRQLQQQNVQLLRTLGAVQEVAEERGMNDVARVAASASSASLTELEATARAEEEAAAAAGAAGSAAAAAGGGNKLAARGAQAQAQSAGAASGAESSAVKGSGGSGGGIGSGSSAMGGSSATGTTGTTGVVGLVKAERESLKNERLQIIREAVRILNAGDRDKIDTMCSLVHHEQVSLANPDLSHEVRGLGRIRKYWRHLSDAFPDFSVVLENLQAEDEVGEKIRLRWTFKGTQVEPFLPVLPSGRSITLSGQAFVGFRDLKVVRHVWSWNHTDLLLNLIGYDIEFGGAAAGNAAAADSVKGAAMVAAAASAIGAALKSDTGVDLAPADGELTPPAPKNMEARIAETISSMVRSISTGNVKLQPSNPGGPPRSSLKRAKSHADLDAAATALKQDAAKAKATKPKAAASRAKPKPRAKQQPKLKAGTMVQNVARAPGPGLAARHGMMNMPQPYLIPNSHMLPGFAMPGTSGIFVALPQNQIQIGSAGSASSVGVTPPKKADGSSFS